MTNMNPIPREVTSDDLIQAYLDKGGTITQLPYGARSEEVTNTSFYQHKKKKVADAPEEGADE